MEFVGRDSVGCAFLTDLGFSFFLSFLFARSLGIGHRIGWGQMVLHAFRYFVGSDGLLLVS